MAQLATILCEQKVSLVSFNYNVNYQIHLGNFQAALNSKFEELKSELIDKAKQGVLTKDQIRQIMGRAQFFIAVL